MEADITGNAGFIFRGGCDASQGKGFVDGKCFQLKWLGKPEAIGDGLANCSVKMVVFSVMFSTLGGPRVHQ
jgi:hypothetical protein